MTVAVDRRRDEMRAMLVRFVEDVGDHFVLHVTFKTDEADYVNWLPTSWVDLLSMGFLTNDRDTFGPARTYRLTADGWLKGLTLSGRLESPDVRERATSLVRYLKSQVVGRAEHYGAFVSVEEVEQHGGVPAGWAWNAVASGLLRVLFPKDRLDVSIDYQHPRMFRVPVTFGQKPVVDL